ncbi:MAG TPA: hypothetical protein EYQ69_05800 [Gemmatimonadetes bacterium]|nr:hypothetical protein [Gemmatimonadota bacterium]
MKTTLFSIFLLVLGGSKIAVTELAESRTNTLPNSQIYYKSDQYQEVQEILNGKCVSCHSGPAAARGLELDSWEHILAGSKHGEALIPFDAERSLLSEITTKLVGGPHPEELGEPGLTDDEKSFLNNWIDRGAPSREGLIAFADAEHLLYAANQGDALISVIDMESNLVIRTVDLQELGFSANAQPHHIAVEPDGSYWYVSLISDNAILKFDRSNTLIDKLTFERPGLLALDPNTNKLYAGRSMAAVSPPQTIGIIDRSGMDLEEMGVFFPRPHALAVEPESGAVYTASLAANQIATLYPEDESIELFTMGGEKMHTIVQFAVSPDGQWMAGTTELTSSIFLFDLTKNIETGPVDTILVNSAPWHPSFTPDGQWIYAGNNRENTVSVVDMNSRTLVKVIEGNGLSQPHGSATSHDGRYVYISNRNLETPGMQMNSSSSGITLPSGKTGYQPRYDLGDNSQIGTVVVIDIYSQSIVKVIEIEKYGSGLGASRAN